MSYRGTIFKGRESKQIRFLIAQLENKLEGTSRPEVVSGINNNNMHKNMKADPPVCTNNTA